LPRFPGFAAKLLPNPSYLPVNIACCRIPEWPIWSQTYFALSPWVIDIDAKKCRRS
jgi:hypothetical protein